MSDNSLRSKSLHGIFWSGFDKLSYYAIQFIVNIILARILTPEDYGVIGIMLVFISFFNIFVDGGFSTALIQKNNADNEDFNTVWVCNIVTSVILYLILIISSPFIAKYYSNELIHDYLKVLGLILPISALSAVPLVKLTIEIKFRSISIANISTSLLAGGIGIYMAYSGLGAWSLVMMYVIQYIIRCIILNILKKWLPNFNFSISSFKTLFSFSSKLIVSSIIDQIYNSLYPLIIGRYFSTRTLGLYTRGEQFGKLPVSVINEIFMRVTLPIMSSVQDDRIRLKNIYREYIRLSSFIIFPIMCWLIVASKPIIVLLLTEKWIEAKPIMQILAFAMMTLHISSINRNLLYALGRSDLALRLEIIKKISAVIIFLIAVNFGVIGVCFGQLLYGLYAPALNSYYTKSLINFDYLHQFLDYGKIWALALVSAILPYYITEMISNIWLQLSISLILYIIVYIVLNAVFNTHPFNYIINYIRQK